MSIMPGAFGICLNFRTAKKRDIFYIYFRASDWVIYLISVLSIVPPKKTPELYDQALAVSENQIEVFRSGIIDKTVMDEAVENFGM